MRLPKALLLLTLSLLTTSQMTFSQDSMYYHPDQRRYSPIREGGYLYRTKKRTDSGMVATYYFRSGKPHYIYHFSDDSLLIKDGEYKLYDSNNYDIPIHTCMYAKNKSNGKESYFYLNGQLQATGTNKDGQPDGAWTGYYPSGKLSGKATYADGKQTSGEFYLEDGSVKSTGTSFMEESSFPGGPEEYQQFLIKTLKYPREAFKQEIQGIVIVQFKVTKEGKIADMSVIRSVDKTLDEEALRALRKMPDWNPAILGGLPVESFKKQPVAFKL